jgi:hypothetical protein
LLHVGHVGNELIDLVHNFLDGDWRASCRQSRRFV